MPGASEARQSWLPTFGVAVRNIIIFVAVLPIFLTTAQELGLSTEQTSSWLLVSYGLAGLLGVALSIFYRQPLLITGNLFAIIFVSSLGDQFSYAEILGAFIVAGGGVLLIGALGLTRRLAKWLPAPVVFGLLAGAILPFVWRIFTNLGEAPLLVGGTFLFYLLSRRFLGERVPAILPALVGGLILVALTGQFGEPSGGLSWPVPAITMPHFSGQAIATVSPVLVVLLTLQANVPSLIFMRDQEYEPPERVIDGVSGLGTLLGSFFGPAGISLSLPATSLVAGREAGEKSIRYRSAYLAASGLMVIGLLASFAAEIPEFIPAALLVALAGLAVVSVLINALQRVTQGPLLLGPLFAFAVALSDISFLGFGPFFWSLVIGGAVSILLERDKMRELDQG